MTVVGGEQVKPKWVETEESVVFFRQISEEKWCEDIEDHSLIVSVGEDVLRANLSGEERGVAEEKFEEEKKQKVKAVKRVIGEMVRVMGDVKIEEYWESGKDLDMYVDWVKKHLLHKDPAVEEIAKGGEKIDMETIFGKPDRLKTRKELVESEMENRGVVKQVKSGDNPRYRHKPTGLEHGSSTEGEAKKYLVGDVMDYLKEMEAMSVDAEVVDMARRWVSEKAISLYDEQIREEMERVGV